MKDMDAKDLIILLITLFLPPLGVVLKVGFTTHFWLNLLLTILGYVPGVVHGVYVVIKNS
jgi:uncharacterized membrane protein YqaE (UPF0057 family)